MPYSAYSMSLSGTIVGLYCFLFPLVIPFLSPRRGFWRLARCFDFWQFSFRFCMIFELLLAFFLVSFVIFLRSYPLFSKRVKHFLFVFCLIYLLAFNDSWQSLILADIETLAVEASMFLLITLRPACFFVKAKISLVDRPFLCNVFRSLILSSSSTILFCISKSLSCILPVLISPTGSKINSSIMVYHLMNISTDSHKMRLLL